MVLFNIHKLPSRHNNQRKITGKMPEDGERVRQVSVHSMHSLPAYRLPGAKKSVMYKLTKKEKVVGKEILYCAYSINKELGPGLFEKIYEICFCHELAKKKDCL